MKILASIVLSLIVSMSLFSQNLKSLGFREVERSTVKDRTELRMIDPEGNPFVLIYFQSPTDADLERVAQIWKAMSSFTFITPSSLTVSLLRDGIEIILIPAAFLYRGEDLKEYLPSGLRFYYTDYPTYDFRLTKEGLFLRMTGRWINEEELANRIIIALEDPEAFIRSQSLEYFAARLVADEQDIQKLLFEIERQQQSAEELSASHDELTQRYERLESLHADLAQKHERLESLHTDLGQKHEELKEELQSLSADYASHLVLFDRLRYAVLTFHNRSLFRSTPIPREVIDRVVELKIETPALTEKEIVATLKNEGIKLKLKELKLILAVYFNEF